MNRRYSTTLLFLTLFSSSCYAPNGSHALKEVEKYTKEQAQKLKDAAVDAVRRIEKAIIALNTMAESLEEKVQEKKQEFEEKVIRPAIDELKKDISGHQFATTDAHVRQGTTLNQDELMYRDKRLPRIKTALEKMLGTILTDGEVPTIAFCASGGGCRAMLATLGFLLKAEETGLLDASMYLSTLSGSTWLAAPWTTKGGSLASYKTTLVPRMPITLGSYRPSMKELTKIFTRKLMNEQPLSVIDLFGGFLAHKFLGDLGSQKDSIGLSASWQHIKDGSMPFPIYTALEGTTREWFEFTPLEVGTAAFGGSYVPTWSLGRHFHNGTSKDFDIETPLGFLMGVFGSAFSASINEVVQGIKRTMPFSPLGVGLEEIVAIKSIDGNKRFYPAKMANFTYGMAHHLKNQKLLTLVDAGVAFNLPLPPLLTPARKVDIIIMLDATELAPVAADLKKSALYAQVSRRPFPVIEGTSDGAYTIFKAADNPAAPIVVHIPFKKYAPHGDFDPIKSAASGGFVHGANFSYNSRQVETVTGLASAIMDASMNGIKDAIKQVIASKRSRRS